MGTPITPAQKSPSVQASQKCVEWQETVSCISGGGMAPHVTTYYNKVCVCDGDLIPTKSKFAWWSKCSSLGWKVTGETCEAK